MAKYRLVIEKMSGSYEGIDLGLLESFRKLGFDSDNIQDIDKFTSSNFENEKELIEFLVDRADELQLSIANKKDLELEGIANNYLIPILNKFRSSVSLRSLIYKLSAVIATDNNFKKYLHDLYLNSVGERRNHNIGEALQVEVLKKINEDPDFDNGLRTFISDYISNPQNEILNSEDLLKLVNYAKNYKPKYTVENGFPLTVVSIEKKANSDKSSISKLELGIAYIRNKELLNLGMLSQYLDAALDKPDHYLLQAIMVKYNNRTTSKSALAPQYAEDFRSIKNYLRLRKEHKFYDDDIRYARESLHNFIKLETRQFFPKKEDSSSLKYLGLRKLAMFVSEKTRIREKTDVSTIDERLKSLESKCGNKTYQISLFDKLQ